MLRRGLRKTNRIRAVAWSVIVLLALCTVFGVAANSEMQRLAHPGSGAANERTPLWGALAIDSNQGRAWGWAIDYPNVQAAQQRALAECGQNCRVVMTFSDQCAAYAADQTRGSTIYGWAKDNTNARAKNRALNACREHGGKSCALRVWGCTSR